MKKNYTKPGIIIESFEIAQNICSCGAIAGGNNLGRPNQWVKGACGWITQSNVIWVDAEMNCTFTVDEDAEGFGVCYNNPSEMNNIFSS